MNIQHIVSVSGGKDSTAVYLLAMEKGRDFRAVFADTGNEHPLTYEFISTLHEKTGGPKVETIKADFSKQFAKRRQYILEHWVYDGIDSKHIREAADLFAHPTGNPFLDLCLIRGRFPSSQARFCTSELKVIPMLQLIQPLTKQGPVLQWIGVRADESLARAKMPRWSREDMQRVYSYRPLLSWTAEDVFALHKRHDLRPNELYFQGMSRVGCMPCIHARKSELGEIARRFPEHIERIAEWERLVSIASKRGAASFFYSGPNVENPDVWSIVEWAKTSRGGKQYDLDAFMPPSSCSSVYGLCE